MSSDDHNWLQGDEEDIPPPPVARDGDGDEVEHNEDEVAVADNRQSPRSTSPLDHEEVKVNDEEVGNDDKISKGVPNDEESDSDGELIVEVQVERLSPPSTPTSPAPRRDSSSTRPHRQHRPSNVVVCMPPAAEEFMSHEELLSELAAVKEENELIKGALRRSTNGPSTMLQMHQYHRLQAAYDKKIAEVKAEAVKVRVLESALAEQRNQAEVLVHHKDVELKRTLDLLASVRAELGALKEKSKEDAILITTLSKENHKLLSLCNDNNVNTKELPPDYITSIAAVNSARPEKASSSKIQSSKSVLLMSPSNFRKEFLQTTKGKAGHRESLPSRGASPNPLLGASPRTRERSRSANPGIQNGVCDGGITTGSAVHWKGMRGTVRYIGPVVPLGGGSWVGVELSEGRGEHSGAAFGHRYFSAAPRSAVFVRITDLIPLKQTTPPAPATPVTPRNRYGPGSPPSTKTERRKFMSVAHEADEASKVISPPDRKSVV